MLYLYLEEFKSIYFTRNFTNIENTWLTDDSVDKLRHTINPFHLQYRNYHKLITTQRTWRWRWKKIRRGLISFSRYELIFTYQSLRKYSRLTSTFVHANLLARNMEHWV